MRRRGRGGFDESPGFADAGGDLIGESAGERRLILLVVFIAGRTEDERSANGAEEILHLIDLGVFTLCVRLFCFFVRLKVLTSVCEREKGIETILFEIKKKNNCIYFLFNPMEF